MKINTTPVKLIGLTKRLIYYDDWGSQRDVAERVVENILFRVGLKFDNGKIVEMEDGYMFEDFQPDNKELTN